MSSVILLAAFAGFVRLASGHASIWHPSMWGFNVTQQTFSYDNRPVAPLMNYNFEQWWFHGHLGYPPNPGDTSELPAGQTATAEIACDKGATTWWESAPGGNIQNGNDPCPGSPPSEYHTTGPDDLKGCSLAIAYKSNVSDVQPEDFVVFSINQTCVWNRFTDFQVPAAMPPCPAGGCICSFFWVHSADSGSEQNYMNGFRCNVTGSTSNVPLATPQLARRCGADPDNGKPNASPGNCTYGAKAPFYWFQSERNNMFEDQYAPPYYDDLYNFLDGAQDDIFQNSYPNGIPLPSPNSTIVPAPFIAGASPAPTAASSAASSASSVAASASASSISASSASVSASPLSPASRSSARTVLASSGSSVAGTPIPSLSMSVSISTATVVSTLVVTITAPPSPSASAANSVESATSFSQVIPLSHAPSSSSLFPLSSSLSSSAVLSSAVLSSASSSSAVSSLGKSPAITLSGSSSSVTPSSPILSSASLSSVALSSAAVPAATTIFLNAPMSASLPSAFSSASVSVYLSSASAQNATAPTPAASGAALLELDHGDALLAASSSSAPSSISTADVCKRQVVRRRLRQPLGDDNQVQYFFSNSGHKRLQDRSRLWHIF